MRARTVASSDCAPWFFSKDDSSKGFPTLRQGIIKVFIVSKVRLSRKRPQKRQGKGEGARELEESAGAVPFRPEDCKI